ncbi:hypothetical protein DSO57_1026826 [Entomophthora muscae]|uniref:Uncharacterized protein n=1 Tax=Entomophthora muscae TaxID=34485 RepID=A0ACC2RGZ0_9FUNG|nr:hypothetical protein DSO57_1026826 [Entomophthora muscae]
MHSLNLIVLLAGASATQEPWNAKTNEPTRALRDSSLKNGHSAPYKLSADFDVVCSKQQRAKTDITEPPRPTSTPSKTLSDQDIDENSLLFGLPKPATIIESIPGFPALEPQPSPAHQTALSYQERVLKMMNEFRRKNSRQVVL